MRVIEDRKAARPAHSYTSRLFDKGAERIGDKIVEEAKEMAASGQVGGEAKSQSRGDKAAENLRRDLAHEAADLLYHMLVSARRFATCRWRRSTPSSRGGSALPAWTKKRPAANSASAAGIFPAHAPPASATAARPRYQTSHAASSETKSSS